MKTDKRAWKSHYLPRIEGLWERLVDAEKRDLLSSFQLHVDEIHPNVIWSGYCEGDGESKSGDFGDNFGKVWLKQGLKRSSYPSNNFPDPLLLLPAPNYDPLELESCVEGLLDRSEARIDEVVIEAREGAGGVQRGYLLEQGGKGSFDDSTLVLPDELPFRKFYQAFEENRVWYPWLYDHPWRALTQWAFKSLASAAPSPLADEHSWVIWDTPGQCGATYQVLKVQVRRERIEIRPAQVKKLNTEGFNQEIQIPLRLVRDDARYGRRFIGRIYMFQQEPEDVALPAGVVQILDHAQAGQRDFRYQALKEKSRAKGMKGRTWHIFHEEQIAEGDEEALVPWARIFELPTQFADQGFQIFLERDVRFLPDLERFFKEEVKEHLQKITANVDDAEGKLILLEADSERNPNAWVLDDEKFEDAGDVIQAIVTSFQPDLLERSPDEVLTKDAVAIVADRGKVAVNLVEDAHKRLEDGLAEAFQLVDQRAAAVKVVLERATELLNEVEAHDSKIDLLANKHLKKGWDPFALEVGKHHKHTLDESRKWASRVVDDIDATCETATATVTESGNRRNEVREAGKRLDVAAKNLKEEHGLGADQIARANKALEKVKSERDDLIREVEKRKEAFQRDQQEAPACLKEMDAADSRVRAEIRNVLEETNKVAGEEKRLSRELARRQREREKLETTKTMLAGTKKNLEDTKSKIEQLIRSNKRLDAEVRDLEKQHLRRQLVESTNKFHELSKQLKHEKYNEQRLNAALEKVTTLNGEIGSVKSTCREHVSKIEKLKKVASKERLVEFNEMKHRLISAAKKLDDRNLLQRIVALFKREER